MLPWPEQFSAEKEFSFRIKVAADRLGHECLIRSADEIKAVPAEDRVPKFGKFVILPHFTCGPIKGIKNVSLLWNSPKTVSEYRYGITNICGSDYLASGGSSLTDNYFNKMVSKPILGELYPSVMDTEFQSQLTSSSKMFYSGINWEKITGQQTRHGEILRLLDRANLVDLYGPKKLRGVSVWQGFKNYKGEIPMDGEALVRVANSYGVSLTLLNPQHIKWEFPSIRIAEAFSAKNVLISSAHPVLNFLEDLVFQIPDNIDIEDQIKYIGESLNWVRLNPESAKARALQASKMWFEKYNLELQLSNLLTAFEKIESYDVSTANKPKIIFLDPYNQDYPEKLYFEIQKNSYEFVVHSQESLIWLTSNWNRVKDISKANAYLLTSVKLDHGSEEINHPSLESYLIDGPSYLSAEGLILNIKKIAESNHSLPLNNASGVFESILLGGFGDGFVSGEISATSKVNWRFLVKVRISSQYNFPPPGKISNISPSVHISHNSRNKENATMRRIINKIPMGFKDRIRPIWLKVKNV